MKITKWFFCLITLNKTILRLRHITKDFKYGFVILISVSTYILAVPVQAAGAFSMSPVRIYMTPKDRATAVTLVNEGDTPVVLQAEVNIWSQKADGVDELLPTEDLILAPPVIKLAPKSRQVVRLVLLKPFEGSRELTYRMLVREVPEINAPKGNTIDVPITLTLSVPIFITPMAVKREVSCVAEGLQDVPQTHSGKIKKFFQVKCSNTGTAYAQIRKALLQSRKQDIAHFSGGVYLLPGAKKTLSLEPILPVSPGNAEVVITFDDGQNQTYPVVIF